VIVHGIGEDGGVASRTRSTGGDAALETDAALPPTLAIAEPPEAIAGFTAGALVEDASFKRRTYARTSGASVTATIARLRLGDDAYARWVEQSRSYPQATLDVSSDEGNGFYDCAADGEAGGCALLIQLRSGVHIEVRGDAKATRADVDAVAVGLAIRRLGR
jgi:hypothetical protein